jgi:glycosyltransferase involved in cell wall biosynthesis
LLLVIKSRPRVSVVMPVRDGERFLVEAVESVLSQTLSDLELIVVDDGSADGTPALLDELARRYARLRVVTQPPGGLAAALNAGCALAAAPAIARLDADDVALPDRLERQLAYLDSNPEVALLGGGIVLVDEAGLEIDRAPGRAAPDLAERNELVHATVVMRTEAFRALGGYRLDQAEDYDLWLRFDERHGVAALEEPVIRYRLHPGQFSVTKLERQALGSLCVRAAARDRRAGKPDPLVGVDRLDENVAARLGVARDEVDRTVVRDAVQWAATLQRVGRGREAEGLLDTAAAVNGAPPRRALARQAQLLLLKRAARHGRVRESARRLAAWARA